LKPPWNEAADVTTLTFDENIRALKCPYNYSQDSMILVAIRSDTYADDR